MSDRSRSASKWVERAEAALAAGDPHAALAWLAQTNGAVGGEMPKAVALRMLGRFPEAIEALDAALEEDPYNFLALLSKGALLERMGKIKAAVPPYKAALKIAPPPGTLGPPTQAALDRARVLVAAQGEALRDYLRDRTRELRGGLKGEVSRRFEESLEVFSGTKRVFVQEPLLLHYAGLPSIPFHDRSHFPWLPRLEAATGMITAELQVALETQAERFGPYIAYPPGAPVNQWGELNHSRRWSSLFLWRDGERMDDVCDACPRTAAVLGSLPMARQPGFAPTAMFSALEPRTRIPPHTGSSNTRLICHLPLILPGPCRFRVGDEVRPWKLGEAWLFDDTIEHEAWNDADGRRVILIFDIWNPLLTGPERDAIEAMMTAKNAFQAL